MIGDSLGGQSPNRIIRYETGPSLTSPLRLVFLSLPFYISSFLFATLLRATHMAEDADVDRSGYDFLEAYPEDAN